MKQQSVFSFSFFLLFLHCTKTLSQSLATAPTPLVAPVQAPPPLPPPPPPVAQVPILPGPIDVAKILQRAGHYSIFVRLLKETDSEYELKVELNHTHNGITIFAPTDSAFSGLKTGTLNDLNDGGKVKLVKFHIAPIYISNITQFETVSNPIKTQAGKGGRFSLNVTTTGNIVNITTGVTNTTISGIVYNDNYQLAIYQIDQVLQPMDLFAPNKLPPTPASASAPAPLVVAPPPEKPKNITIPAVEAPDVPIDDVSRAVSFCLHGYNVVILAVSTTIVAAMF
ncbi:hypothetical protein JCGZ_05543 [Jatropha curcas]|uniref:FAS1 domain-containing protein n=1 Tax=Jatropha curcas TaxID=180498 RepID=A0A067L6H8_JATCU|nr:fasciclin-like arabinogalactan protein 12 [Jatropha curcas]KDP44076.1 hypothetical protein JCGZ_05543 [Jatropha curcas]